MYPGLDSIMDACQSWTIYIPLVLAIARSHAPEVAGVDGLTLQLEVVIELGFVGREVLHHLQ